VKKRRKPDTSRPDQSLAGSTSFRDFVLDQLSDLGDVRAKSMFGGVGLYCDEFFFGLIARDTLYLKVDETNRDAYVRSGMKPFKPYADRPGTMQYYEVPVGVLESPTDLVRWARQSVNAARRAASSKRR
jgi:DNA transformation protein